MPERVRSVNKPIAWVGHDRILLDDVTPLGLHRRVIACKGEPPNMVSFLQAAYQEAGDAKVHYWLAWKADGFCYLWIVWKEG